MAEPKSICDEFAALLRACFHSQIKQLLQNELSDAAVYSVYKATDGKKTQEDAGRPAGASQPTVSRLWTRWLALGLVVPPGGDFERPRALFDPEAFGVQPGGREKNG